MKTPIDTVKGTIYKYNPETGEILIRARYDDVATMLKRGYRECLVQMIDARPLSDKQRKACYALLSEIADFSGMGKDAAKEYMKLKFLAEDLQETADHIFSLSDGAMSLVCAFQNFLVKFILDWDIPTRRPLLELVDDISSYLYACLANKKCCVCGARADLHHVVPIGMGADRTQMIHEGLEVMPLCRLHHTEMHQMTRDKFLEAYHLDHGIPADKTICKIYGLKMDKDSID